MRKTLPINWNLKDTLDYISQAKDRIFMCLCNKFLFFSKQMCMQRKGEKIAFMDPENAKPGVATPWVATPWEDPN
jgi:hypothetical protein